MRCALAAFSSAHLRASFVGLAVVAIPNAQRTPGVVRRALRPRRGPCREGSPGACEDRVPATLAPEVFSARCCAVQRPAHDADSAAPGRRPSLACSVRRRVSLAPQPQPDRARDLLQDRRRAASRRHHSSPPRRWSQSAPAASLPLSACLSPRAPTRTSRVAPRGGRDALGRDASSGPNASSAARNRSASSNSSSSRRSMLTCRASVLSPPQSTDQSTSPRAKGEGWAATAG